MFVFLTFSLLIITNPWISCLASTSYTTCTSVSCFYYREMLLESKHNRMGRGRAEMGKKLCPLGATVYLVIALEYLSTLRIASVPLVSLRFFISSFPSFFRSLVSFLRSAPFVQQVDVPLLHVRVLHIMCLYICVIPTVFYTSYILYILGVTLLDWFLWSC